MYGYYFALCTHLEAQLCENVSGRINQGETQHVAGVVGGGVGVPTGNTGGFEGIWGWSSGGKLRCGFILSGRLGRGGVGW